MIVQEEDILDVVAYDLGGTPDNFKLVFTNGCFDVLHAGHVRYLKEASDQGNLLYVAVNSDESVKYLKGDDRPIVPQEERCEIIDALKWVDVVIPFKGNRVTHLLSLIKPHIFVKGGDYTWDTLHPEEKHILEMINADVHFAKLISGKSTTNIIQKIQKI